LKFYSQFINPGDIVFDIGANVGVRTDIFLKLGAHVIAVEPNPKCVRDIERIYGCKSLFIEQCAIGNAEGTVELMIGDHCELSTTSPEWLKVAKKSPRFACHQWRETIKVPVRTLNSLVQAWGLPNFVKIDVEGSEAEVLQSLSQPIPCLSFEFNIEFISQACKCIENISLMENACFNVVLEESFEFCFTEWISNSQIIKWLVSDQNRSLLTYGDIYVRLPVCTALHGSLKESVDEIKPEVKAEILEML
jgi:FkbM family methyltransferase